MIGFYVMSMFIYLAVGWESKRAVNKAIIAQKREKSVRPCFEPFPSTCGPDEEKCDMGYIDGRCWSGDYCVPKGYSLAVFFKFQFC